MTAPDQWNTKSLTNNPLTQKYDLKINTGKKNVQRCALPGLSSAVLLAINAVSATEPATVYQISYFRFLNIAAFLYIVFCRM